ncbi:MAG: hypothetical protein V8T87_04025 [Victivallales bacterium]
MRNLYRSSGRQRRLHGDGKALNDFEATTVTDLTSEKSSTWLLPFLVIWYNSVQVSGNAIR